MISAVQNSALNFPAPSHGVDRQAAVAPRDQDADSADHANLPIRFATGKCSLGLVLVASSETGVCAILFGDDQNALLRDLEVRFPEAQLVPADQALEQAIVKVITFIEAPAQGLDLPLDMRGTEFQLRVWQALREIPVGSTASYSDIAQRIGAPKESYAVGGACAANRIAVAIPCHRVVKKDGTLGGYRWGFSRKRALLKREAAR